MVKEPHIANGYSACIIMADIRKASAFITA
jgi:hypothetical protein